MEIILNQKLSHTKSSTLNFSSNNMIIKKTVILLFFICVAWFSAKGQQTSSESIGIYDANDEKTGEWKYFYNNGQLEEIGSYKSGERTGEWKFYYENGQLGKTGSFKDDDEFGEWKYYDNNGKLTDIGSYKN